jgi:hypothetical protein
MSLKNTKGEIAMADKFIRTALCLVLFIILFACSSLSCSPAPTPASADIEREEWAVYSFFLPTNGNVPLILERTSSDISSDDPKQSIDYIKSGLKGISNETVKSYLARNAQPSQLSADMDLGIKYKLLTADELKRISSQPNWGELLTQEYPGSHGYTVFSRVGFNHTLDQAVIYVGNVGGPMMGSGSFYLMEKQNGEWILKEEVMSWIS